jgi:hypothetical protein
MKITRGVVKCPIKCVVYGVEKVGKTTLASMLPNPLFIPVEDGTNQLDVARTERPNTWQELRQLFIDIGSHTKEFDTIVIDSADWSERLAIAKVNAETNEKERSYGKDQGLYCDEFGLAIKASEWLVTKGYNVVWVAHSKVTRVSPPDQTEGYDKYELKMGKATSGILKEWADVLLFINTETLVVEGGDGKKKSVGGTARVIHAAKCSAWDAGNRFALPESMPYEKGVIPAPLLRIFTEQTRPTVRKPDEIPGLAGDDTVPPSTAVNTAQKSTPVEPVPSGSTTNELPGTFADAELQKLFGGQEAAAHAYLVRIHWLPETAPLSALPAARVAQILAKPASFAAAANLTLNNPST